MKSKDLVRGLPQIKFLKEQSCETCIKGEHTRSIFKSKNCDSTSKPLELLHIDFCGLDIIQSRSAKRYIFIIVDEFSCFHGQYS